MPRTPGVSINNPPAFGCIAEAVSVEAHARRGDVEPVEAGAAERAAGRLLDGHLDRLGAGPRRGRSGGRASRPRRRSTGSLRRRPSSRRGGRRQRRTEGRRGGSRPRPRRRGRRHRSPAAPCRCGTCVAPSGLNAGPLVMPIAAVDCGAGPVGIDPIERAAGSRAPDRPSSPPRSGPAGRACRR